MESQSADIAARAARFFGIKPGQTISDELRDDVKKVAWWMIESEASKHQRRDTPKRLGQVLINAIPEPQTPIEVLLGLAIAKEPCLRAYWPQLRVGPYTVDFGFRDVKLAVECDGAEFHREPAQILSDQKRTRFLSTLGWRVIRFMGWEIRRSAAECVARIVRYHEVLKALG